MKTTTKKQLKKTTTKVAKNKKITTINDLFNYCKKNNYEILLRKGHFCGYIKIKNTQNKTIEKNFLGLIGIDRI